VKGSQILATGQANSSRLDDFLALGCNNYKEDLIIISMAQLFNIIFTSKMLIARLMASFMLFSEI
jgi:hypothetical protein